MNYFSLCALNSIHKFHNLSWITEINELFHDFLIYWDAPVHKSLYSYNIFTVQFKWLKLYLYCMIFICVLLSETDILRFVTKNPDHSQAGVWIGSVPRSEPVTNTAIFSRMFDIISSKSWCVIDTANNLGNKDNKGGEWNNFNNMTSLVWIYMRKYIFVIGHGCLLALRLLRLT